MNLRRILQGLAGLLLLGGLCFWLARGANRGWTKTSVPVKTLDPVLGIEAINYEKRFVPGVEFLGVAVVGAGILGGCSFLVSRK